MTSSLSSLVNNLAEGIRENKCKFGHDDSKFETYEIKCKDCNCFLECTNFKVDLINLIEYKCLCCTKNYQK